MPPRLLKLLYGAAVCDVIVVHQYAFLVKATTRVKTKSMCYPSVCCMMLCSCCRVGKNVFTVRSKFVCLTLTPPPDM